MRRTAILLLASAVLLGGAWALAGSRALAAYNISGDWMIDLGGGPCPATITQSYDQTYFYGISIKIVCPSAATLNLGGAIDIRSGGFGAGNFDETFVMTGSASADNHTIDGTWYALVGGSPLSGSFHGTGGNGDPKPPSPTPLPTATPSPGLDFSLGIDVNGDATDDCTTKTSGPQACELPLGSTFALKVYLNSLPDGVPEYVGFDLLVSFTGVSSKDRTDADQWPDCVFKQFARPTSDTLAFGCGTSGTSAYTGLIGTAEFNCVADGTLTLIEGSGGTDLLVPGFAFRFTAGPDSLRVRCARPPPVGGISRDADARALPAEESRGPAHGAALLAEAIGGSVAAVLIVGTVAWNVRRRRLLR